MVRSKFKDEHPFGTCCRRPFAAGNAHRPVPIACADTVCFLCHLVMPLNHACLTILRPPFSLATRRDMH